MSLAPPPPTDHPSDYTKTNVGAKKNNEDNTAAPSTVFVKIGCFIHAYKDEIVTFSTAIIGIFTIALVVVTGSLARSTRTAADAARLSAQAAVGVEPPKLFVTGGGDQGMLRIQPIDRPLFGVLCLAAVSFFACAIALSLQHSGEIQSDNPQRHESVQKGEPYQSNSSSDGQTTSVGFQIECDPNCTASNRNNKGNDKRIAALLEKLVDDPIAICTLVLAVANVLLVALVVCQVRDNRKSSERQLRAYIGITGGEIVVTGANELKLQLVAENQGQTPALDVEHFINAEIRKLENEIPGAIEAMINQKSVMSPKASWDLYFPPQIRQHRDGSATVPVPWLPSEVEDLLKRNKEIVIWGIITYRDVFPQTPLRETRFCYRRGRDILPPSDHVSKDRANWEAEPCADGNSAT